MDAYNIVKKFTHKNLIGKEDEVLTLYYTDMAPILYISDKYECSTDTINKWFKANNFKIRNPKESLKTKGRFRVKNSALFGEYKFTHPNLVEV